MREIGPGELARHRERVPERCDAGPPATFEHQGDRTHREQHREADQHAHQHSARRYPTPPDRFAAVRETAPPIQGGTVT